MTNPELCAALGIDPVNQICMCDGQECRANCRANHPRYPDLTSPQGFVMLWDALRDKGWRVDVLGMLDGYVVNMHRYTERGDGLIPDLLSMVQVGHETRHGALIEAACKAILGKEPEPTTAQELGEVIDIMQALKDSLQVARGGSKRPKLCECGHGPHDCPQLEWSDCAARDGEKHGDRR